MSFVPGDPTYEQHALMPSYGRRGSLQLPYEGWKAPASWTIWPHMDYEDLSKTMPKALHKFEDMSELEKLRISVDKDTYIPESEPGYMIKKALDEEVGRREREIELIVQNEKIEKRVLEESERRWSENLVKGEQEQQKRWLMWWDSWRLKREEEIRKEKEKLWPITEKDGFDTYKYFQLSAIAETGAGDTVIKEKDVITELGISPQQYEDLERKFELDNLTLEERKDKKRQEYEDFIEPQTIRRHCGWSMHYIYHDEITLWNKPFIYCVPDPTFSNPREYTKPHWNFIKEKLPTTSPIMNEWGDIAWRFVHGTNFKSKYQEMKYRNLFLTWINSHISLKEEPVPRELFVMSQMLYYSKIIRRVDFQKLINLFGSRGYFEKPIYNRRLEISRGEPGDEIPCPVNGCPFIEVSNYFGGLPNCRKTAWYFNWHWYKLKNIYLWCFDSTVCRLYKNILYPGRTEFVCEGEEVVEYLHDDWDGYHRPNYRTPQRVLIHRNQYEDYPMEFYHNIVHRLAAEENWIIGIPHWEAGRYAFNFIHYAYIIRHFLTFTAFFTLYIGRFHPQKNLMFTGLSIAEILGALFYRIYFDGSYLIEYDYYPNIFHYYYSPIHDDPEHSLTQFFENKPRTLRKTVERGLYKFMTVVTMAHAFYRFCWPDAILCSLPCDMLPPHPYPYHPEGKGPGIMTYKDWPLQFAPPPYSAQDLAMARSPYLSSVQKTIAVTGGILTVGVSCGAVLYLLITSF